MNSEELYKQIFGKEISAEDFVEHIGGIQNKYPWFALPHFYKFKSLGIGEKDYNKYAALTAQFFPNVYLLNQRLQEKSKILNTPVAEIIPTHQEHENEEPQPVIEPVTKNNPKTENEIVTEVNDLKEVSTFRERMTSDISPILVEHENEEAPTVLEPVIDNTSDVRNKVDQLSDSEIDKRNNDNNDLDVNSSVESNSYEFNNKEIESNQKENKELPDNNPTINNLEKVAAEFKKPTTENNGSEPILFEPLHATDYFASQGIKLSEDLQSKDKLGKQMKSFTDWLKVMKKTPEQQQGLQHVADERQIQNLADKSNTDAEIITESMADVYLQQNKKEKAREIYKKLSLINPDKSAYFAAKIDNLNKK